MKNLFIYIFILSSTSLYGQEDGSETFNALSDAIKPSIPSGYILNSGLTWDNSFLLKITFNQNESEENQMIYSLSPGSAEFSEMDRALATEEFNWQDRSAMYQDGSETGMSSIVIILNNLKSIFIITNRTIDLSAMNKAGLEGMLSNIDLFKIE